MNRGYSPYSFVGVGRVCVPNATARVDLGHISCDVMGIEQTLIIRAAFSWMSYS